MKVHLVVASGVHKGKLIPVPGLKLLIGRDPECQLRPASPAVSKKHCVISIRGEEVYVEDLGSTNGTFVNDVQLTREALVDDGDRLRIGPLEFTLQIAATEPRPDNTPLPESLKSLPQGGRLSDAVGMKPAPAANPETDPAQAGGAETKPAFTDTKPGPKLPSRSDDADSLAAMLLSEGDDDSGEAPSVPDGSTVTDLPLADLERIRNSGAAVGSGSSGKKKPVRGGGDSSNAADELLKKFFKRPK